ncbi:hypothetical protein DVK02_12935 [Halobellus sp. Atlit-31R]|nr:hypothetical protein DVK02_12935 [Halobellus sp. Atlit-31R]
MTRRSQRHRTTTLPFPYRENGLQFDIDAYSVDGRKPVEMDLKPGQSEISLVSELGSSNPEESPEWNTISVFGQIALPESTIEAVFPPEERESPPAKLYVAVRCHETIYRDHSIVSDAPTLAGPYDVQIRLHKEELRGRVELRPYLVRTEDRDGEGQFASKKNFRVAGGKRYELIIDKQGNEEPPAIDGENVSFSQTPHLPDGEKLYYLDFRNEKRPKLWINADHPRIADVLQSRGSVGAEARMRDVILDQVSYGVWSQLLVRAGSSIDDDGDVEYDWQQTVLETFVRNLYAIDDLSEAMHRFRQDIHDPDSLPHLMGRIDRELQEYIDHRAQLINLMEEGLQI